ncbi:MAG: DUF2330 domain-containing protein [Sandaracinaceae bacterium]|nr:DUF2330 domain-containing protein [Sandaracinaceae bacterium]
MKKVRSALVLAMCGVALAALRPTDANACGRFGRTANSPIRVDFEEALIVWDAAHQTEHFIRSASFLGVNSDFGFVVPTPSQPTMTEIDEAVFRTLAEIYTRPTPAEQGDAMGGLGVARGGGDARARPQVTVVATQYVAGMDATVLRANDAGALAQWLSRHGLATPPGTTAWLAPYVRDGWYLTAFLYHPARGRQDLVNRAVRMSFHTDRPFFPYSEPANQRQRPGRRFRVTVVADTRMDAFVGAQPWSARVGFAGRTASADRILGPRVPDEAWNASSWFTTFEETNSIRGREELYFRTATTTATVPPSIDFFRTDGAATQRTRARTRGGPSR